MTTVSLLRSSVAAVLLLASSCSSKPATACAKGPTMEYDGSTGQWKPAGPAPTITVYPHDSKKGGHLSARSAGLQVARCMIMVAKTPMIGVVLLGSAMAPNGDSQGIDRFIEGFDPGPALDQAPDPGHGRLTDLIVRP